MLVCEILSDSKEFSLIGLDNASGYPILYWKEEMVIMGTFCFPENFKMYLNDRYVACERMRLSGGTPTLCYRITEDRGTNSRTWTINADGYRSAQEAITKVIGPKL